MTFLRGLEKSLAYIKGFFGSHILTYSLNIGLFDLIEERLSPSEMSVRLHMELDVLLAILWFLLVEKVIDAEDRKSVV